MAGFLFAGISTLVIQSYNMANNTFRVVLGANFHERLISLGMRFLTPHLIFVLMAFLTRFRPFICQTILQSKTRKFLQKLRFFNKVLVIFIQSNKRLTLFKLFDNWYDIQTQL